MDNLTNEELLAAINRKPQGMGADVQVPYAPPEEQVAPASSSELGVSAAPVPQAPPVVPQQPASVPSGVPNIPTGSGLNQMKKAIQKEAQLGAEQAAFETAYLQERIGKQQEYEKEIAEKEKQRKFDVDVALKKVDDAKEEIGNYKFQDYWANKSIFQKITAALAIGIGQFGANLTKSENMAMKVIEQSIEQHVLAEKARYQGLKDKVGEEQTQYGLLVKKLGDEKLADDALREISFKKAKDQLDLNKSKLQGGMVLAKADQLSAQLQMAQDQMRAKMYADYYEKLGAAGAKSQEQKLDAAIPYLNAYAVNKNLADKLNTEISDIVPAIAGIDELIKINATGIGKSLPMSERKAKAESMTAMLTGMVGKPLFGILSAQEQELVKQMMANPANLFSLSSNNLARLQSVQNLLATKVSTSAQAAGINHATKDYVMQQARRNNQESAPSQVGTQAKPIKARPR